MPLNESDNHVTTINIPTADGSAEALVARPQGQVRGGVLMFMDAIGLRPRVAEMAAEIASWGYVVLAPNTFYRDGSVVDLALPEGVDLRQPEGRAAFFASGVMDRVHALSPDLQARDSVSWMATLDQLRPAGSPVAAVGYCMGAGHAVRAAAQHDAIVAAAGFHGGGLVTDAATSPHRVLTGRVRYLFGHADNDASLTPENAADLDRALVEVGASFSSAIYPGAPHGFTMSDTASWHEPSYARYRTEFRELVESL